jgi:hypothetical protein
MKNKTQSPKERRNEKAIFLSAARKSKIYVRTNRCSAYVYVSM